MPLDTKRLDALLERQHQVVSRAQLRALGFSDDWIARQVQARRWTRPLPGVYVAHTGEAAWATQAQAALLYVGSRGALSHSSAAFAHGFSRTRPRNVELSVPHGYRVTQQRGMHVYQRRLMPPITGRLRTTTRPATAVDLAAAAHNSDSAIGVMADAVRARTAASEIRAEILRRRRLPRRALLLDLVDDVATGIESPLEHRYHHRVEAAHGLPTAVLQHRQRLEGGWIRSDGLYTEQGVRVELDGQLGHPGGSTDADVWRDNAVLLATNDVTLRYRWRHVDVTPCRTARQVGDVLTSRGWSGHLIRCGPSCTVFA